MAWSFDRWSAAGRHHPTVSARLAHHLDTKPVDLSMLDLSALMDE
jgi:hypothetical protein